VKGSLFPIFAFGLLNSVTKCSHVCKRCLYYYPKLNVIMIRLHLEILRCQAFFPMPFHGFRVMHARLANLEAMFSTHFNMKKKSKSYKAHAINFYLFSAATWVRKSCSKRLTTSLEEKGEGRQHYRGTLIHIHLSACCRTFLGQYFDLWDNVTMICWFAVMWL
jgi:hypothetical protein